MNRRSNAAFALVGIAVLLERPRNSRLAGLPRTVVGLSLCALSLGICYMDAATRCTRKKHTPRQFVRLFAD